VSILGIIASSRLAAVGDFESIATVTVGGGGAATVEFTSIPALIAIYKSVILLREWTWYFMPTNSDSGIIIHNIHRNI
jgi:hypothetical protein